ncbi:hypothetical protein FHS42_006369 [Streptomyces zagrosensis]|uniref:Uncharacterized protein n=1 Tax=Streptomyces zagrosensis TaxID=1042984 RepID=A0A7W9QFP8_9ACTN|nr:hypothetical protein [Streptomyces zagrosensis]
MLMGASGDYWKDKALPSVFKHDLLKRSWVSSSRKCVVTLQ